MTDQAKAVLSAALALPDAEREEIAEVLFESVALPEKLSPEWAEEIQRRITEIDEGRATLIPAEQVFAEVRAILKNNRQ